MDFSFINDQINKRYITLEANIKSKCSSFYDAYLDLLETTLKYILDENNISYDQTKTCGLIVREHQVKSFLIETINVDEFTYSKLPDYIKKCNDHKHKKEKKLEIEAVINFMQIYYNFLNYYLEFKELNKIEFDSRYYISIFNKVEKSESEHNENYIELAKKTDLIENKIDTLLNVVNEKIVIKNDQLQQKNEQIMVDNFIKTSKKTYYWYNPEKDIKKSKRIVYILFLIMFLSGIISTYLTTKGAKLYTTYSFFENIWLFAAILILIKFFHLKEKMTDEKLMVNSIYHFEMNRYFYLESTLVEKKRFKVFRRISHVCCFLNILCHIWLEPSEFSFLGTIFELMFFVSSLIFSIKINNFYEDYGFIILFEDRKRPKTSCVLLGQYKFVSIEEVKNKYNINL